MGKKELSDGNQVVAFYEVGIGSDRRFPDTRNNIVPFTRAEKHDSYITFTNLDLIPGHAVYYCTVRAHSTSLSTATVTSNGFYISYNGGVAGIKRLLYKWSINIIV